MALILEDYDLTGGATDTTEVVEPNNWRVTATVEGANSYDLTSFSMWVEDEDGNWAILRDDADKAIVMSITGNGTRSLNVIVANAANGRVHTFSATNGTGTVTIDSINS